MDLKEAIYNRRSIRVFQDREVEPDKIRQLIDAAQWAPSACNKQGWRFIAVSDRNLKENIVFVSGATKLIKLAPLVIFVLYEKHLTENKSANIQSASAAIQNLLLSAHSLGLGGTWLTSLGKLDTIRGILKIPDGYEIIAGVILGYPKEKATAPARKRIEEILSFDCFNFKEGPYPFTYDVKKWPLNKIIKFREDSMRAASPLQSPFPFDKPQELEKEITEISQELPEVGKILEVLPFAGTHTVAMLKKKKFKNYHLFELSQQPIEFIKQRLANDVGEPLIFTAGSVEKIPYQDNFFDAVLVFQKLEMLPDLRILDEIFRVLKPGGKFLLSFKNMTGLYGFYYWHRFRLFNREPIWNYGPFTPFNYFKIKKIIKERFDIKGETGITPLIFIGKTVGFPLSIIGRLVIFKSIVKK